MKHLSKMLWKTGCAIALLSVVGCTTTPRRAPVLAPHVDVPRFMGKWYVIASIPVWLESDSYNGIESYALDADGRIRTTYTFRDGGFDGPLKTYRPVATVFNNDTGSEWRMQFIWPFRAAFLIHDVAPDYSTTIIGEPDLQNVWIMARAPQIPESTYTALVSRAASIGYDTNKLRRVPQKWDTPAK
jgi:apolipoprotein D and lipocalin family protein